MAVVIGPFRGRGGGRYVCTVHPTTNGKRIGNVKDVNIQCEEPISISLLSFRALRGNLTVEFIAKVPNEEKDVLFSIRMIGSTPRNREYCVADATMPCVCLIERGTHPEASDPDTCSLTL